MSLLIVLDFLEVFAIIIIIRSIVKSRNSVGSAKCPLIKHSLSVCPVSGILYRAGGVLRNFVSRVHV